MERQRRAAEPREPRQGTLPSRDPSVPSHSRVLVLAPHVPTAPHVTLPQPLSPPQLERSQPPRSEPFSPRLAQPAAESSGGLCGQPSTTRHFRPNKHRLPCPGVLRIGWCGWPTCGGGRGPGASREAGDVSVGARVRLPPPLGKLGGHWMPFRAAPRGPRDPPLLRSGRRSPANCPGP
jgi:hypothetical protein